MLKFVNILNRKKKKRPFALFLLYKEQERASPFQTVPPDADLLNSNVHQKHHGALEASPLLSKQKGRVLLE